MASRVRGAVGVWLASGAFVLGCSAGPDAGADGAQADGGVPSVLVALVPPEGGACRDASESTQRHGTACLCCHSDEFGVAGSVDPIGSVSRVVVTGADGDVADMVPDSFGNFFRHFPLATPVTAVVYDADGRPVAMHAPSASADCNACHTAGGAAAPITAR